MTVLRVLNDARALLHDGWTTRFEALNGCGNRCSPLSPSAAKFCLTGSLTRATMDEEDFDSYQAAIYRLWCAMKGRELPLDYTDDDPTPYREVGDVRGLEDWNDEPGRTKEEVLELVDKAKKLMIR